MSCWLAAQGVPSTHELISKVSSWAAYRSALDERADCCTYGWAFEGLPRATVIIHRPLHDVYASLADALEGIDEELPDLSKAAEVMLDLSGLHVPFDTLDEHLEEIHRHLQIPHPFDPVLAENMRALNIQMDMSAYAAGAERAANNVREALRGSKSGELIAAPVPLP